MHRSFTGALLVLALAAPALAAQNSIYGIRGLGFPSRMVTARGRALGSGPGALDPLSPINPATVAGLSQITVAAMTSTDFRDYSVGSTDVGGLHATRFPLVIVGGRAGKLPIGYAVSFASYTERSYDIATTDTVDLRGEPVVVTDRTTSRGGTGDLRFAVGWQAARSLRVGAGFHIISGSSKLELRREFSDSAYRPFTRTNEEQVGGLGFSAGVVWRPRDGLELALAGRTDTQADIKVDSVPSGTIDLPVSLIAGVKVAPHRAVLWSTTVIWRSWSSADPDVLVRAFDTWEIGSGFELGGAETGASRVPLRVGVRYATLPFSPTDQQPHELDLAIGSGVAFAGNRGVFDIALERALRKGGGASEQAWQVSVTMTVRP